MKKNLTLLALSILFCNCIFAQTIKINDTIPNYPKKDTLKIGNVIIITKKDKNNRAKEVDIRTPLDTVKRKTVQIKDTSYSSYKRTIINKKTNWITFDIGFNNYKDATNYSSTDVTSVLRTNGTYAAPNQSDFKLNTGKSININLWIVTKKIDLIKKIVGLKYGIGLEYYNFTFNNSLSFKKDLSPSYIIKQDNLHFKKNKLAVNYVSVPLMLTLNPNSKSGISLSAGVSAAYRYSARNKQVTTELGKQKNKGDYDLNPWKFALTGDIGFKIFRLYGSYSLTPLHEKGLNLTPYAVGLRFSKL